VHQLTVHVIAIEVFHISQGESKIKVNDIGDVVGATLGLMSFYVNANLI